MRTIKVPKGKSFRAQLWAAKACPSACNWVGRKSLRTAWRLCERADWMLWLAIEANVDERLVQGTLLDCARHTRNSCPSEWDYTPTIAFELAKRLGRGLATLSEALRAFEEARYVSTVEVQRECAGLVRARIPVELVKLGGNHVGR